MSILDALLGRPIATREEHAEKIGPAVGIPVLGLDALASAAYGPEAALTILLPLGALGLGYSAPILGLIILLLFIVFLSYQQTIAAYPSGGGSYVVARANLGSSLGLLAAAALMLDYVLVVAVGISVLAALLLVAFQGVTDRLIPLFAIGAFAAFTVSQAGRVVHWHRQRGQGWPWRLAINALGCLSTGLTLVVVLLAKFQQGAWITLLLIPCVIALFASIHRHYRRVSLELATSLPIDSAPRLRPLVVVPISGWSRLSRQALQLARNLSDEVHCVHVCVDAGVDRVQSQWEEMVEKPLREAGQPIPRWVVLESPYRRLFTPLLSYLEGVRACQPEREILVVVGELVENRWYQFFLHNQHAQVLKALLWLHGGRNVAVVSTPWRLS